MDSIILYLKEINASFIITFCLLAGSVISGVGLLIIKKRKKKNEEEENAYQRELASEYREEWLKQQNTKDTIL